MTQKLTEEQQRAAHKIIVANRGDCKKGSNYLYCADCAHYNGVKSCLNYRSTAFQAENLRRSQAWLDEHITDAEIMAETPKEFCERMVRTEGYGNCIAGLKNDSFCKSCPISVNGNPYIGELCFSRAKAYLASHPATPQEPAKRRPTPEEMVVGATVRVRLWDELVRDGKLDVCGHILFYSTYSTTFFDKEMRQYCGNTYKIIVGGHSCHLDGCWDWTFIPEMLDYVEPEKVVKPKTTAVNFFDWCGKKVVFKDGRDNGVQHTVCSVIQTPVLDEFYFKIKINEFCEPQYSARLFNLCETKDAVETEPVADTPAPEAKEKGDTTVKGDVDKLPLGLLHLINFRDLLPTDALRIIALEGQVDDLTKKLAASKKLCDRQQRRLRANWEAKRDGEMATREEIIAWFLSNRGGIDTRSKNSKDWKILPNGHTDWMPATLGNLKLCYTQTNEA